MYRVFIETGDHGQWGDPQRGGVSWNNIARVGSEDFETVEEARAYMAEHSLPAHQFCILEVF